MSTRGVLVEKCALVNSILHLHLGVPSSSYWTCSDHPLLKLILSTCLLSFSVESITPSPAFTFDLAGCLGCNYVISIYIFRVPHACSFCTPHSVKFSPTLLHRLCLENMILSFQASALLPFCISFSLLGKQVLCLFDFVMPLFPRGRRRPTLQSGTRTCCRFPISS